MTAIEFDEHVHFTCPFCSKQGTFGTLVNGDIAVTHELPYCPKFGELDALDFMDEVSRAYRPRGQA